MSPVSGIRAVRLGVVAVVTGVLLPLTLVFGASAARPVSASTPADAAGSDGAASVADTTQRADATARWVWPTGTRVVSRPWEPPADDYAAGHRGMDVPAGRGLPAVAVEDGEVAFAGSVAGRGVVTIDHGDGLVSTLDSVTPSVTEGDVVEQGDEVGRVSVGHCPATEACLHIGARVDDRYVDPMPYLPAAEWPVLLPESAWTAPG